MPRAVELTRELEVSVADQKRQLKALKSKAKLQRKMAKKESGTYFANRLLAGFLIAGLVALVGLVAATFQSSLLAIEKVTFEGNQQIQNSELTAATSDLLGEPLTTVNEAEVAAMLDEFLILESFAIQSRPPHELVIRIRERQPLATVFTTEGEFVFDAAGVRLSPVSGEDLPRIMVGDDPAESESYRSAVEVLLSLPLGLYRDVDEVRVTSVDNIELTLEGGTVVIWGDNSQAKLKHEVLLTLIANQTDPVNFDVSAPLAPVVIFEDF